MQTPGAGSCGKETFAPTASESRYRPRDDVASLANGLTASRSGSRVPSLGSASGTLGDVQVALPRPTAPREFGFHETSGLVATAGRCQRLLQRPYVLGEFPSLVFVGLAALPSAEVPGPPLLGQAHFSPVAHLGLRHRWSSGLVVALGNLASAVGTSRSLSGRRRWIRGGMTPLGLVGLVRPRALLAEVEPTCRCRSGLGLAHELAKFV